MKILVMGAGAVGAYFGGRLQQAGEQVVFCARGENLRALQQHGLHIESFLGNADLQVSAAADPAQYAPYDLILFCVKAYDTEKAADAIKVCLAPNGVVLTLQNGVENEDQLIAIFGAEAVMGGNARVGVELVAPGRVLHLSTGTIDFGELDGHESPRARAIADAFKRAGILGELTPRIRTMRWDKLMWNAAFNTVTALTRRTVGELLDEPETRALVTTLMEEVRAVAAADGAEIPTERVAQFIRHSENNLRALKTSTLQDVERGKRLEYEALSGAVVRAARKYAIAVPATQAVYALLRIADRRRDW